MRRSPRNQFLGRRFWCPGPGALVSTGAAADITKDGEFSVGGRAVDSGGVGGEYWCRC